MFQLPDVSDIVALALAEDLGLPKERFAAGAIGSNELLDRDVTSASLLSLASAFEGVVVARERCTVAGLAVVAAVFETLSRSAALEEPVEVFPLVAEGARVEAGTAVAEITGPVPAVLAGERTALNFLMLLSGIATEASHWADAAGPGLEVCDTRKTVPGLRALSKYAVAVGGASNHRSGLYDMVLVKDNHLAYASCIEWTVQMAHEHAPGVPVEVEADTLDQALEAIRAEADLVLLDNFDDAELSQAVRACRALAEELGRDILLEASGGIRFERIPALRAAGVDRISTSALTFAPPVDFGLDEA